MFFQLVKKEIVYQLRNITFYLFIAIILLFYSSQFTGDIDIKGIKPVPGQEYYGSTAITDKTEEIKAVYKNMKSNLNTGDFLKNGLFINKTVKLSGEDKNILSAAAEKIAVSSPDGSTIELKVSYEEYLKIVRELDKSLGGNTPYGDKYRKTILHRPMTYEEAMEEFNNIVNKDKITNAYGRLFGDYMGITAGIFPIFISAFVLTRDKRSRMYEIIYSRSVKSHVYVFAKFTSMVIVILLGYLIAATHASVKFGIFAAENNYIIDYFAFYKYVFLWILPTIMFTTAFGMLVSIIFGNGIAAVPVQFILWMTSIMPLMGNYALSKILIRFNTAGRYGSYILWKQDIMMNRLFYTVLSVVLVYITSMFLSLKRGGGFGLFTKNDKNNTLQCKNNL